MEKIKAFKKVELVDWFNKEATIPENLEHGVLYYSQKYHTCIHLCACGCGNETVTPIIADRFGRNWDIIDGWTMNTKKIEGTTEKDRPYDFIVTLLPSIGNYNFSCKSHYYITDSKIIWP